MSLFLGKIHYLVYNKIKWFRDLEVEVLNLAKEKNVDIDALIKNLDKAYGERVEDRPLEELIDTSNIHEWLQEKMIIAENRLAQVINTLKDKVLEDYEIKEVFKKRGRQLGNLERDLYEPNNAILIYNALNNYVLDGMPCDRANEILEREEERVSWRRIVCTHKNMWDKENVDANYFYEIRNEFIKEFIESLNSEFTFKFENENSIIERI